MTAAPGATDYLHLPHPELPPTPAAAVFGITTPFGVLAQQVPGRGA